VKKLRVGIFTSDVGEPRFLPNPCFFQLPRAPCCELLGTDINQVPGQ
jgi:hypothetical protein